jgi:hypothetical protein
MAEITVTLSTEELRQLKDLGQREGLTVDQVVKLGIQNILDQPDESFHKAAQQILKKNAELYRRLA